MSTCTAKQAVSAFAWWLGYYEKATSASAYLVRDKSVFASNAGSGNYTYAGKTFGLNGPSAPWCAMQDSLAILEACGGDWAKAKTAMFGYYPHYNCGTIWDCAAKLGRAHWSWYGLNRKGKSGSVYTPKAGDLIIFTDGWSTRDHTGMVYAADSKYVYTYEGNSSNQCRKRSYLLTSSYIYGYCTPVYDASDDDDEVGELYGDKLTVTLHELSKGCAGPEVATLQRILYARGIKDGNGNAIVVDGDFGKNTKAALITLQKQLFPSASAEWDGVCGAKTWAAMLTQMD
jgi:hypothetical protein